MKSFKEYLQRAKRPTILKLKSQEIALQNCVELIKEALSKFDVATCAEAKRTPIQESHADFPDYKNVHVTVYDICLNYPATGEQVRSFVAEKINKEHSAIRVRTPHDEKEYEINHENDEKSGKSMLSAHYEKSNNQDLVGEKKVASFLKELSKTKTAGEQYKGVNDKILAKKVPAEKTVKAEKATATKSPISGKGK